MKRALLATVLALGATITGATAAQAAPPPGIDWQPCAENAAVECSTITVPIDHARPSTGTIEVAVARRKATDPANRTGVLMYMPGGPGGSGVSRLLGGNPMPPAVAARFDVVSFDPRGTNRSNPVTCDADLLAEQPKTAPTRGVTLADVKAYSRALADSCREHTGPLIDHIDSVDYAYDIDAIRAALGERKLTLYGISYGTLTGQMYAENFPHRVRAMLLDSVFDHSLDPERFVLTEAEAGEDAFVQFENWCATDPTCVLHGQDVGQVYREIFDTTADPVSFSQATTGYLYGPRWPELAEFLSSQQQQQSALAAAETAPFPLASYCADHRVRFSSQREWEALYHEQSTVAPTLGTHFAWGAVSLCSGWTGTVGNPQHRTDADDAPPILLMNSLYDPATGYAWAKSVHRQLDDSVLLTYDGWGHGVIDRSDCTRDAATRYLVDNKLPRPGTHCAAVAPPTAQTAAAEATAVTHW
jgi:pimeloyl-ACP methyl ester carboxylesterase